MTSVDDRQDRFNLFRAYDIRGEFGKDLDPQFYAEVGMAACKVVGQDLGRPPTVYVGYDVRMTSPALAYALVAGMASVGAKVIFAGEPFPFGVVLFSGLAEQVDFTAFVTASHLPPHWNGCKFYYGDGVGVPEEKIQAIRDRYLQGGFTQEVAAQPWDQIFPIPQTHHRDAYYQFLQDKFALPRPLRVVLDCGNGSASLTAVKIFERCGYTVQPLWCDVDPSFPNRPSEPNPETLVELSKRVVAEQADFGVGFDGDGDRAVIVDDTGAVLAADSIAVLLARYLTQPSGQSVATPQVLANIECSTLLEANLADTCEVVRIKVGHTFLTLEARNRRGQCVLGVESSGHFVFPNLFLFDDSMPLPLYVGLMLTSSNEKLSELVARLPRMEVFRKVVPASDDSKFKVIEALVTDWQPRYPQLNTIDGLAIPFEGDGYLLIRASNTGPKIRVFAEAKSKERLDEITEEFVPQLEKKIHDLS